jgi:hypothetical protein
MTVTYTSPGALDSGVIGNRWVIVFGGVSRQGNRRSRRTAASALRAGLDVVWFDGFEETYTGSEERVALDGPEGAAHLVVVGIQAAENLTFAGRLRTGGPFLRNPITKALWKVLFRRLGTLLRARACWKVVRDDVHALADLDDPAMLFYGDDYAITSAWYAGKIWTRPPILAQFPDGDE